MRRHNARLVRLLLNNIPKDLPLCRDIQCGRRLVQKKNRRVAEQRAGTPLPACEGFDLLRDRRYGRTQLSLFRRDA